MQRSAIERRSGSSSSQSEIKLVSNLARRGLFWAAAVFAFVMGVLPHPPELPGSPSDKIQHAIAFVTLGFLGDWAYRKTSVWKLLIGLSLFGAFIEVVQAIPMLHRDSDPLDWLTDTIACGIVLFALRWWHGRKG